MGGGRRLPHRRGMDHAPPLPDRTRTGAVWVTALGAFMLFAAAAVFVAVRWQDLTDALKLAIVGVLTGLCLLGGRALRTPLPATAGVVFHLGAFLVPVNVAAVAVHLGASWPVLLLVEGISGAVVWGALAHLERSRVLVAAAAAATVVAAAGVSATADTQAAVPGVPTALLLAVAAVGAEAVAASRRRGHAVAIGWAVVAGTAPVLGLVERVTGLGTDVAGPLGLSGRPPGLTAAVSGLLAAGVLARNAHRRRDVVLAVVAAVVLALGGASAWAELAPDTGGDIIGLAGLFLAVEVAAAWATRPREDGFWAGPARVVAGALELAAALGGLVLLGAGVLILVVDPYELQWEPLVAGGLAAAGWMVAGLRRVAPATPRAVPGWSPATAAAPVTLLAGLLAGTGHPDLVAAVATLLVVAVLLGPGGRVDRTFGGRAGGPATAVVLATAIPLVQPSPLLAIATGLVNAGVLAGAAVAAAWRAAPPPPGQEPVVSLRDDGAWSWLLPLGALAVLGGTALLLTGRDAGRAFLPGIDVPVGILAIAIVLVLAITGVAAVLDRAPMPPTGPGLAIEARLASATVLLLAIGSLSAEELAVLAALVGTLALVDAIRLDHPGPLWALPVALPVLTAALALAVDDRPETAGVALAMLAVASTGIHLLADGRADQGLPLASRWGLPPLATAGVAVVGAGVLTVPELASFATVVAVAGGIGLMLGTAHRRSDLTVLGALLALVGAWLHLTAAGFTDLDAYAAPAALVLAVAGWHQRRAGSVTNGAVRPVGSWAAYAPAVALLGGAALAERLAGGPGLHALVAGAVGVVAVAAGGARRLVGPLVTGTALLVALTVHESLGVTSQIPTWGWLAAGGTALVAIGLWLERRESGPLETGRRLVDVVTERFS
jgi:hypothetical protein